MFNPGDRIYVQDSSKQRCGDSGTVKKIVPSWFPFQGNTVEIEFDDGTVEDNFPLSALAIKIPDSQEVMDEVEKTLENNRSNCCTRKRKKRVTYSFRLSQARC